MNIAPVQKGVYTLGKRTDIPGMGKFDPLSQMKVNSSRARCAAVATLLSVLRCARVAALTPAGALCAGEQVWNETVGKETEAWSRGLRENPPSTEFRVVRPDRMYFADGKPAFSQRAVDRVAEKNRERERRLSAETGKPPMGEMSHEEKQEFMDTLRQTARTPLEKLDAGNYTAHWRGATLGKGDMRRGRGETRAGMVPSSGVEIRCRTPIQASHDIGWFTQPLVKPGNASLRLKERTRRKSCNETLFADSYFACTRIPFTSKYAGTGR
eukprot:COSAG06_NODE_1277_length_10034_cov_2.246200_2_plen_269_part_00